MEERRGYARNFDQEIEYYPVQYYTITINAFDLFSINTTCINYVYFVDMLR